MTWAVYSMIGSSEIPPQSLKQALLEWVNSRELIQGLKGSEPHYTIDLSTETGRGSWLSFSEPRGDNALWLLVDLATFISRKTGYPLWVYVSGSDGGYLHTILGYKAVRVLPDGSTFEESHHNANGYIAEVSPINDDCPYEEFHELLEVLHGHNDLEYYDSENYEFSSPLFCKNARLNDIIRKIRTGSPCSFETQPNGQIMLRITHPDGCKQMAFLTPEEDLLIRQFIKHD